jgi:hypothetical protein
MVSGHDINASIRQPSAKPSLVGLSDLSATNDIHAEPVEMNVLAFNHTNHHPAERLQVTDILPLNLALIQISRQRIIKTGSREHRFDCFVWLLTSLNQALLPS